MAVENNISPESITKYYFRLCQKCESKMHKEHKYCVCGNDIGNSMIYETETKPNIFEKRNLDLQGFSCENCCKCRYCASYGMSEINSAGYGSLHCKHSFCINWIYRRYLTRYLNYHINKYQNNLEVIGNIHDQPELLKEA